MAPTVEGEMSTLLKILRDNSAKGFVTVVSDLVYVPHKTTHVFLCGHKQGQCYILR